MMQTEHANQRKPDEKPTQITDFVQFFTEITGAYRQFKKDLLQLNRMLTDSSPQELRESCRKLCKQKAELEILDRRMFAIIDLSGNQISGNAQLKEHGEALAQTKMASDILYRNLQTIKAEIQEEIVTALEMAKVL